MLSSGKISGQVTSYTMNLPNHAGEKSHKCAQCGKSFDFLSVMMTEAYENAHLTEAFQVWTVQQVFSAKLEISRHISSLTQEQSPTSVEYATSHLEKM